MTRLSKKCFLFSAGMHGALLLILVASSAFRSKPHNTELPILPMIPANIVDGATSVSGSRTAPQPAPPAPVQAPVAPPVPQPTPPRPQPVVERTVPVLPTPKREVPRERVEPQHSDEGELPPPKPVKHRPVKTREIVPTFDPVNPRTARKISHDQAEEESHNTQRERNRRLNRIASALNAMATEVKHSGAAGTAVDMPGQADGPAFADYKTVIYNVYHQRWIVPDSTGSTTAATDVKIIVSRDGSILSAEIINPSGDRALDRSVDRVLQAVRQLPPFPAGAQEAQRTFLLRFDLESKEGSG
jgi:TonB family protein